MNTRNLNQVHCYDLEPSEFNVEVERPDLSTINGVIFPVGDLLFYREIIAYRVDYTFPEPHESVEYSGRVLIQIITDVSDNRTTLRKVFYGFYDDTVVE